MVVYNVLVMSKKSEAMGCSFRSPEDDFFCEKYGVWYPIGDCNYRVLHRTFEGCVDCFQGRINLRRLGRGPSVPTGSTGHPQGTLLYFPEEPEARPAASMTGVAPPKA